MERSKFETFGCTFGPGCQWSVKPRTLGIPKGRFQFRRGCAPGGASMSPIHFYRGFRPILILNGGCSGHLSILVLHRSFSATANAASPSLGIFPFRPEPVFLRVSRSAGPYDHSDHSPAGSDDQYARIETPPTVTSCPARMLLSSNSHCTSSVIQAPWLTTSNVQRG